MTRADAVGAAERYRLTVVRGDQNDVTECVDLPAATAA